MQLEDWLDDLCVRFIVNIPAEELVSLERICFQIEEAQWFYEDFVRPADPSLPSLTLKTFFQRIVPRCPIFHDWDVHDLDGAFEKFLQYKNRVPVRGAILLNDKMDEVILVKGWKKSGTWSFPRGKINKDEDDLECAIREAWEETGFDIRAAGLVSDPRKIKHIEKTMRSQNMKMFVFRGVSKDAHFEPQTRKEISKIEWFRLADLPTERKKANTTEGTGQHLVLNANKFYVVAPFMHDLKKIITAERRKDNRQSSRAAPPVTAEIASNETDTLQIATQTLPMSPAIPSSLPEVSPPSASDPLHHLSRTPQPVTANLDAAAKSNALMALLRNGPAAQIRNDLHTPHEQINPPTIPRSPERPSHAHAMASIQSPPPAFDLHQQMHPTAPKASALPQLSQHTRSLLDAFNGPTLPQNRPVQPQLPPAKQDLLAAFTSKPFPKSVSPRVFTPVDQGGNLLQLLQRPSSNAPERPVPIDRGNSNVSTPDPSAMVTPTIQLEHMQRKPASTINPLLDLLKDGKKPSTPNPGHAVASGTDQVHTRTPDVPSPASFNNTQTEPVELSATTEDESRTRSAVGTKDNLRSLSNATSPEATKPGLPKSRVGTTSATLAQPIDEPQFEAIARAPTFEEESRTQPAPAERKLFDYKTGNIKQVTSIKAISRQDDRSKQPRSPRNTKQQRQTNSPRRPVTPKELTKPFQPQILKRPQTRDGDDTSRTSDLPLRNIPVPMTSETACIDLPSAFSQGPLSPSLNAPEAVNTQGPIKIPTAASTSSQLLSPVHDPQREALLSLLKTPAPKQLTPEPDATPKASFGLILDHEFADNRVVSPPSASQLISPIAAGEVDSAPRSRVSSLASVGMSGRSHHEKRQTGAEDKAFLMQYLKGLS
ncbi:mRNA-decapping enzyme subunit 2 [Lithohypha guttulata]|uniref:mRNA-decapping enzyme subunit 2 n=1 Tax=Lithohypha guttulata TaxID=1690604 RepID=A0AAN7SZF5_9EURO|nr:mRNA-decapping enzyme subunit 2 [Lithohypha guttulata]